MLSEPPGRQLVFAPAIPHRTKDFYFHPNASPSAFVTSSTLPSIRALRPAALISRTAGLIASEGRQLPHRQELAKIRVLRCQSMIPTARTDSRKLAQPLLLERHEHEITLIIPQIIKPPSGDLGIAASVLYIHMS